MFSLVHDTQLPSKHDCFASQPNAVPTRPPASSHSVDATSHTERVASIALGRHTLHCGIASPPAHGVFNRPVQMPVEHESHSPSQADAQQTPAVSVLVAFQHTPVGHVAFVWHDMPTLSIALQSFSVWPAALPKPGSHWHTPSEAQKPWPLQLLTVVQFAKQSAPEKPALHVHVFAPVHLPPPAASLQLIGNLHVNCSHSVPL